MLTLEYLVEVAKTHNSALKVSVKEFSLGGNLFAFNARPAVMGVINLSPDSWYRESVCLNTEMSVRRAKVLQAQGADIIDIGAESTLGHASRQDEFAQRDRLLPVLAELKDARILTSIETYLPSVARECLDAGANVINLTGTENAPEIYRMVQAHDAGVIICYVQGANVRTVGDFDFSADSIPMMREYFERQIEIATRAGVKKIIIDPGLGFYYRNLQDSSIRIEHQIKVFLNTFRLRELGYPVCHALPHAFECFGEDVRCAEPFFAVLAALGKTDLLRTHEVSRTKAVLKTMRLIGKSKTPPPRESATVQ